MKLKDKLIVFKNLITRNEPAKEIYPNDILACIGEFSSSETNTVQKYSLYRSLENGSAIASDLYQIAADNTVEKAFPYILYPREDSAMSLCEFEELREHYESLKQQYPEKTQYQLFLDMKKYQETKKSDQKVCVNYKK